MKGCLTCWTQTDCAKWFVVLNDIVVLFANVHLKSFELLLTFGIKNRAVCLFDCLFILPYVDRQIRRCQEVSNVVRYMNRTNFI